MYICMYSFTYVSTYIYIFLCIDIQIIILGIATTALIKAFQKKNKKNAAHLEV